jgi:uncharacterized NAD(P)/FAD-binding protein YdhS
MHHETTSAVQKERAFGVRRSHYDVLIIGGGYAGVASAIHILRRMQGAVRMAIVEPRARLGRGVAYDTLLPCHLLNTRAHRMSLRPHDPQHYARWARRRAAAEGRHDVDENSFTPRAWFGDYVEQELKATLTEGGSLVHLRQVAVSCERVGSASWAVGLADGRRILTPLVVLALGNPPRRSGGLPGLRSLDSRVVHAWDLAGHELSGHADVLILGTGLTMVDAVLSLESSGHSGAIHAISRHGLLPLAHVEEHGHAEPLQGVRLQDLSRELRAATGAATRAGQPWQWQMDAVRHQAHFLWRGLTITERKRFLRHARTYWDVHRHRVAPEIAKRLEELQQRGRLSVHRARLGEIKASSEALQVSLRDPRGARQVLQVEQIINSLGVELNVRGAESPLLQNLLRTGVARPGLAGLGIHTDPVGRLQAANGYTWPSLFALGSLRAGEIWETTAAYEIQNQAIEIAECLAGQRAWYAVSV